MKLVIAIVHDDDADELVERLIANKFRSTKLASTGGFLKEGNTTLMMGVDRDKIDAVIDIIKDVCKVRKQTYTTPIPPTGSAGVFIPYPIDIVVGGATIFVVDIDRFEKV